MAASAILWPYRLPPGTGTAGGSDAARSPEHVQGRDLRRAPKEWPYPAPASSQGLVARQRDRSDK